MNNLKRILKLYKWNNTIITYQKSLENRSDSISFHLFLILMLTYLFGGLFAHDSESYPYSDELIHRLGLVKSVNHRDRFISLDLDTAVAFELVHFDLCTLSKFGSKYVKKTGLDTSFNSLAQWFEMPDHDPTVKELVRTPNPKHHIDDVKYAYDVIDSDPVALTVIHGAWMRYLYHHKHVSEYVIPLMMPVSDASKIKLNHRSKQHDHCFLQNLDNIMKSNGNQLVRAFYTFDLMSNLCPETVMSM